MQFTIEEQIEITEFLSILEVVPFFKQDKIIYLSSANGNYEPVNNNDTKIQKIKDEKRGYENIMDYGDFQVFILKPNGEKKHEIVLINRFQDNGQKEFKIVMGKRNGENIVAYLHLVPSFNNSEDLKVISFPNSPNKNCLNFITYSDGEILFRIKLQACGEIVVGESVGMKYRRTIYPIPLSSHSKIEETCYVYDDDLDNFKKDLASDLVDNNGFSSIESDMVTKFILMQIRNIRKDSLASSKKDTDHKTKLLTLCGII